MPRICWQTNFYLWGYASAGGPPWRCKPLSCASRFHPGPPCRSFTAGVDLPDEGADNFATLADCHSTGAWERIRAMRLIRS